jgi:hypothetical protein
MSPAQAPAAQGYPLPPIPPPHARSAHAGDGRWSRLGRPGDRAAAGDGVFYVTTLHPHPSSRFIALTIVSVNLGAARLGFVPGTEDVGSTKPPEPPGLVPVAEQDALLAAFNGGFQPRHGHWGMQSGAVTIVPPRPDGCTIALTKDGLASIQPHASLAGAPSDFAALRQTPPCLLHRGAIHADLLAGRDKIWGGRVQGVVTRRRSALGIDASGRVLFYAIGIEASPRQLAEGLKFAGADSAAELDVNWNWTRFMLFGQNDEGKLRITSNLVEAEFSKLDYVERPSQRDFFYVTRR